tara:strand:- start:3027 stop:3320 length:294 start_codon:yes stop_codon:yes gene_type:complete
MNDWDIGEPNPIGDLQAWKKEAKNIRPFLPSGDHLILCWECARQKLIVSVGIHTAESPLVCFCGAEYWVKWKGFGLHIFCRKVEQTYEGIWLENSFF